jgi:hypothetical protein
MEAISEKIRYSLSYRIRDKAQEEGSSQSSELAVAEALRALRRCGMADRAKTRSDSNRVKVAETP